MILQAFFFVLALSVSAQTPSFVPRADLEGSIGTSDKQWGTGYFGRVYYDGEDLSNYVSSVKLTSFNGSTGDVQIVGGDGVSVTENNGVVTISLVDPDALPSVGTNRVYFRYTGYTNYWTVPSDKSNIAVWAWGAGGSGGSTASARGGYGGFSYGEFLVNELEVLSIAVGQGGRYKNSSTTIERSFPDGGSGASSSAQSGGGGGSSAVFWGTNILIVAGGGGGGAGIGSSPTRIGGDGGGLSGQDGVNNNFGGGGTQTEGGTTPSITPVVVTNEPGGFFYGGNAGLTSAGRAAGGGGGGYYGGGGAVSSGTTAESGGGGSGFINILLGEGITIRANNSIIGSELPEYISGVGIGAYSGNGSSGLIVIGY